MGPRLREDKGRVRGLRVKVRNEGWVLAFARRREGGEDDGRRREGWVPACARTRERGEILRCARNEMWVRMMYNKQGMAEERLGDG